MCATIDISKGAVQKSFTTRNRNQKDKMVVMRLVEGPFSHLEGSWRFDALGEKGCKVTLDLKFGFASRILSLVVGPVFTKIANTLVDSFQNRARDVYGQR
jgi:ribosome-associated toxin RatA of RatAB toxin-antitoxin module